MATSEEKLKILIEAHNQASKAFRDVQADVDKTTKKFEGMATKFENAGKKMSTAGSKMSRNVSLPILGAAALSVKAFSDLNETMSKVEVSFGNNSAAVKKWSKGSIASMGLAQQSALDSAALFGDMGTGMGQTTAEAAKMSMNLTQLGADMASFKNVSTDRAQTALAGIYTGETEALKSMGVVMTQTNLEEFARSKGIQKSIKDMTQQEKIQLRYNFVMEKTKNAQGDFARTSDSIANRTRAASERTKQLSADFGEKLAPAMNTLLDIGNKVLDFFNGMSDSQQQNVIYAAGLAAALGPVLKVTGAVTTNVGKLTRALGDEESMLRRVASATKNYATRLKALSVQNALARTKTLALTAAEKIRNVVTKIGTAIQAAFNAIMAMNPFVAIAIAVIAFIAVLVVLFKKNKAFRDFIMKAWDAIKNAVMGAWQNVILPALKALGEYITNVVVPAWKKFAAFMSKVWDVFVWFYNVVAPPVMAALKILGNVIMTQLWPALKELWKAFVEVGKVFVEGGKEIWKALQPIVDILVGTLWPAIQKVGSIIMSTLWPALQKVGKVIMDTVWPAIQSIASTLTSSLAPVLKTVGKLFSETILPALAKVAKAIGSALVPVFSAFVEIGKKVWDVLQKVWKIVGPFLLPVLKILGIVIGVMVIAPILLLIGALIAVAKVLAIFAKALTVIIKIAAVVLSVVFKAIALYITKVLVPAFKIIMAVVKTVFQVVAAVVMFAWTTVIQPIFNLIWNYITNVLIPVWKKIFEAVQTVFNSIVAVIQWAWTTIIQPIWNLIVSYITNVLVPIWTKIWDTIKWVFEKVSAAVKLWWAGAKVVFEAVWSFITETLVPIFQKIWDKVSDVFTKAWEKISGFKDSVVNAFKTVKDKITDLIDKFKGIKDKVTEAFGKVGSAITAPFKTAFKAVATLWNNTLGKISFTIPNWVPKMGGKKFSIPKINVDAFYKGTRDFGGGLAMVGDVRGQSGELVNMPRGTDVFSNRETKRILRALADGQTANQNSGGGGLVIHGDVNLGDASAVDRFFERMDRQAELAALGAPV